MDDEMPIKGRNFQILRQPRHHLCFSLTLEPLRLPPLPVQRLQDGDYLLVNKVCHGSLLSSNLAPCTTFCLSLNGLYLCVARDVLTLHPMHMQQEEFVQHNQLCLESQRPSSQKQTAAQIALYQREVKWSKICPTLSLDTCNLDKHLEGKRSKLH